MIQFSNPSALWLLSLIVPLILLYLLKRRRREVRVPSLLLWKQALEDMRAHTPFQKLRSSLLLLLQILAIVLITAILSGPHVVESTQQSRRWVLVLDTSASMQATDESPNRFTVARKKLLDTLDSVSPSDEVLLATAGSEAAILQSFSSNHAALRARIDDLAPEDAPGNWQQLGLILQPLLKDTVRPRIVIASDFAGFPSELQKLPWDPLPAGKRRNNAGIVRVAADPLPENPEKQILFYQITNYSNESKPVVVELSVNDSIVDAFESNLDATRSLERNAELVVTTMSKVDLRLKTADDFSLDNHFVLLLEPAKRITVTASLQNPFLRKALQALPAVTIAERGEVTIADTDNKAPGIYFHASDTAASAARILQWDSAHPSLRYVDAGLWTAAHIVTLEVPPKATVLMETARGPAAYAIEEEQSRRIHLGFALDDSNLFQLAGFPVFLQNAITWIHAGSKNKLPTLTGPQRKKIGPYEQNGRNGYANFADPDESNIAPGRLTQKSQSGTQQIAGRKDLSLWFLILAVGIVMLEWWAFHRRVDF